MHANRTLNDRFRAWIAAPSLADADLITRRAVYWFSLGVIVLIALALRAWNLASTDLWSDEMHTLMRIRLPLVDAIDTLMYAGNQTPLYYVFLRWLPGESIQLVRWTSVILGLVNVVLISEVVVALYGNRTLGLALAALVAVHPMHVVLSRTARYYTLVLALSLLVTWCFLLLLQGRRGKWVWGVFGVGSLLLYMLHYTALALPATQFLYLLLNRRKHARVLLIWIPVQIAAVLPLIAWYAVIALYWFTPYLNGPVSFSYAYLGQQVGLIDFPISVLNVLLGFGGQWDWLVLPGLLVGAAGLLAGLWDAVRAWSTDRVRSYWALLAVITFLVLFALGFGLGAQYRDRYYIISMGAVLIMFGLGVRKWARPLALSALALVLLTSLYITLDLFRAGEHERSDWSAVADYLDAQVEPGDTVIVERELIYDLIEEYVGDDSPVVPALVMLEGRVGSAAEDITALEPPGAKRLWVVFRDRHEDFHLQAWEAREPLTRDLSPTSNWLLAREARIKSVTHFGSITVYLVAGLP